MTRRQISFGVLALTACLVAAPQAHADHVEQIDLKQHFDADVIVNGTKPANVDGSQAAMDFDENTLITKGAAKSLDSCTDDPDGLPDDGKFAKTPRHPAVRLGYSNTKNGDNARQMSNAEVFEVDVPAGKYREIHVFATSGNGNSEIAVTPVYEGDSGLNELTVWDWFDTNPDSGYALIKRMDRARADASACFDDDGAAVWGYEIETDESIRLDSVEIARTDGSESFLNVLGMTGVRARAH